MPLIFKFLPLKRVRKCHHLIKLYFINSPIDIIFIGCIVEICYDKMTTKRYIDERGGIFKRLSLMLTDMLGDMLG